ncbi:NBPF family member NBPF4-like isoform X1 [Camelus bactrianus]|uniref:NBPF family member NBPF4-like isoform X1 n=2 Tax=Camelus bactrianus TaxID=9837 RepID=A0AC58QVH0_CAMBA
MAGSLGASCGPRAELTVLEINQELHLELTKQKQDFRDLTQKFLVCQATTYCLANQLQKYKCEEYKDIIESVLGEKLQFRVVKLAEQLAEKLAEKPVLAEERFREYDTLICSQARELTQLRQKLWDGREDSILLIQQLRDVLTHNDLDNNPGQGFREQLTEGCRLAERLARKLSPEIHEDEEDELEEETLTPSIEQEELEEELLQESQDECVLNPSVLQEGSDCNRLDSEGNLPFDEEKVSRAPDVAGACSHVAEDPIPADLPENQNECDEAAGQEPVSASMELEAFEKEEVLQESQDECVLNASVLQEGSDCNRLDSEGHLLFDEEKVGHAPVIAGACSHVAEDVIPADLPENQNECDEAAGQEPVSASMELEAFEKEEVLQESQDECVLNASVLQEGPDYNRLDSEGHLAFDEEKVGHAPDVAGACSHVVEDEIPADLPENQNECDEAAGQEAVSPSMDLLEVQNDDVLQESRDECVLAPSIHQEGSDCYEKCSDGKFAFPEQKVLCALEVACGSSHVKADAIGTDFPENQNDQDGVKGVEPTICRLSTELPQMVEDDIPRHSVEEYYLTYSALPDLSDSFWPYRSTAIYSFEGLELSYARDVTSEYSYRCDKPPTALPENHTVLEEEEEQDQICPSAPDPRRLSSEQPVVEENEGPQDSLDECYLTSSVGHDLSDSCRPDRGASFPWDQQGVFSALAVHGDSWEDRPQGPLSFQGSEMEASQAQLQTSTQVTHHLQLQRDQQFDCGDGNARLGLPSTVWGFTANTEFGDQGLPLQELGLDASIGMKIPPKVEGEGSAASQHERQVSSNSNASSVLKQKILRRKLLRSKWRIACRFPGLQA